MSGLGAGAASNETSEDVATESDAMYHVRLIHSWSHFKTSPSFDKPVVSSFYGLQLELQGTVKDHHESQSIRLQSETQSVSESKETSQLVSAQLHFDLPPSSALLESLDKITGPLHVIVRAKVSISNADLNEDVQAALSQMATVQVENYLVEINGKRLQDDQETTGGDLYRRLCLVASRASLASPFELTMRRHNLALVAAKIVPFAQRKDVQEAQMAQLATLVAQDAALPSKIRQKKLFLIQQLDFEREYYLVPHVSALLQTLHAKLMDSCQWQRYEVGKTSWYFYAPTLRLCAEHPFRSHPEARELITRVQEQIQQAVRKLQRQIRFYQRRRRLLSIIRVQKVQREEREQRILTAVLRIQHQLRLFHSRKRLCALIQNERRQKEVSKQQLAVEEREEEKRQVEQMKLEQQRLQQEVDAMKLELKRIQLTEDQKHVETESCAYDLVKEEQRRLQERFEKLELKVQSRNESKNCKEIETQTSARDTDDLTRRSVREEQQTTKVPGVAKVAAKSTGCGRQEDTFRGQRVETKTDLEWQSYLTLLRESMKSKRYSPVKNRCTQTISGTEGKFPLAFSMLPMPQDPFLIATTEWKRFPSVQESSHFESSSNGSNFFALKRKHKSHTLDVLSPPFRTLESFFAPERHKQPPPPLVDHSWRNSAALPFTSQKIRDVAHNHRLPHECPEPINTMENVNSWMQHTINSSTTAKLPYIIRKY